MRVNADFSKPVTITPKDREWVASPSGGVERCMLDRIGGEVARATSFVRFAPGSSFPTHTHGGGEEYLVVEGTFSDETGDFPAGTYVRNPIGTAHAPHTNDGCTIFVKLHQFAEDDVAHFDTTISDDTSVLHETSEEIVQVLTVEDKKEVKIDAAGGAEILVLSGAISVEDKKLPEGSWARFPTDADVTIKGSQQTARIWVKTGHLAHIRVPEGS